MQEDCRYKVVGRSMVSTVIVAVVFVIMIVPFLPMHFLGASLAFYVITGAALPAQNVRRSNIPPPPDPEPIEVVELPLPPVAPSNEAGSCTLEVNPRGTGCIQRELGDYEFQSGDFTPDGNHVVVNVKFVGAPEAGIYNGEQLILVKADGTTFANGDTWKCLSCAVPEGQKRLLDAQRDYPHVFRSGDKALWGHK